MSGLTLIIVAKLPWKADSRIPLRPFNRRRGSSAREANGDIGIKAINSRCLSDQGHILARHGLIGVAARDSLISASRESIADRQNYLRWGGPASWHPVREDYQFLILLGIADMTGGEPWVDFGPAVAPALFSFEP
jgi:hypothetical protein